MGLVVVSLSTAYAFAEFFGVSGSLDDSFKKSKTFYILFGGQMLIAAVVAMIGSISLFQIAVLTQTINAVALPLVFFYLIKLTNDKGLMGEFANNSFQKIFSVGCTILIIIASVSTVAISIYQSIKS
jgi:Mn2+/Fe2+ NRAMP family transporter